MVVERTTIFDRTLGPLRRALFGDDVAGAQKDLSSNGLTRLRQQIDACLDQHGGEVSARVRAAELGRSYLSLNADGREKFLRLLADAYDVEKEPLDAALRELDQAEDSAGTRRARRHLRFALEPRRVTLLRQFNAIPQGVKFLVDMRADLLPLVNDDPAMRGVADDLRELLASWFDIGFLDLKRITWNAPASLLEKLIAYEAVHKIQSWDDLKNRLGSDRRCFAFFHPRMPDEPLIFVEVALVHGIAGNVQVLLDEAAPEQDAEEVDTAIFYSISNAQDGLAGVSFGNFLIKRVVDELRRDLPNLKTFATLSPIPGFRRWLDAQLESRADGLVTEATAKRLAAVAEAKDSHDALAELLARPEWWRDGAVVEVLQPALMRLCARYLTTQEAGGRTLDRVEHFHLSNGARLERINWLADTSQNGVGQSAGIMVNYLYRLQEIEQNHEAYTGEGRLNASTAVRKMLK